jgi:hypothetical protein
VLESGVLRKIFGLKKDEVKGSCRKLYHKELHNLCCSADISRVIKSWTMWWAGHVAFLGEKGNSYI